MSSDADVEIREVRIVEHQANQRPLRVLLAEDDSLLRELTSSRLRDNGYLVVEAQSGEQALPMLLAGEKVDLLITDISMPGSVDGWGLAERARLVAREVLVVYTSSRPRDAHRQVRDSLYVRKPYYPDALIAAIQRLVGRTDLQAEAEARA